MLIFDKFESVADAKAFINQMLPVKATLHMSQEESNKIDPFPYILTPPIVLVDRRFPIDQQWEAGIIAVANEFCGTFAGT